MKKIIFILFLLLSLISCYLIYHLTKPKEKTCLVIGDTSILLDTITCNNQYIEEDNTIKNLTHQIYYNIDYGYPENINQLLNKADILIISIGKNNLSNQINKDTYIIYSYINKMIKEYDNLLTLISKYDYEQVYIIGLSPSTDNVDIYTNLNYKLSKLIEKYHYIYINNNNINTKINELIK